jgi:hypothetical protein
MMMTKEPPMAETPDSSVAIAVRVFADPAGTEPPSGGSARAPPRDVARESL